MSWQYFSHILCDGTYMCRRPTLGRHRHGKVSHQWRLSHTLINVFCWFASLLWPRTSDFRNATETTLIHCPSVFKRIVIRRLRGYLKLRRLTWVFLASREGDYCHNPCVVVFVLSIQKFNLAHYLQTVANRDFKLYVCIPYDNTFPLVQPF